MKRVSLKGLLSWILVGSLVGLGVAGLRLLFNWDRAFTNLVLFSLVGVVVGLFAAKFIWDYAVMRSQVKSYQRYLANYDMPAYLEYAQKAVERTKTKAYQNIHRMNLSLGYAYTGAYREAIDTLSKVNIGDKLNSSTNLVNILNLINYTIQDGDLPQARKLIQKTAALLEPVEDHPKYGFLIHLNRLHMALKEKKAQVAEAELEKAELFQNLIHVDSVELTLAKAATLVLNGNLEAARSILEPLRSQRLAPVFERQREALWMQLKTV